MNSSHCRRNVEEKMKSEEIGLRFKNSQWQREISKSSWIYGLMFFLSVSLTLTQLSHSLTLRLAVWNSSQLLIIYRENFTFCFMIALGFFFSFSFFFSFFGFSFKYPKKKKNICEAANGQS
jgi:hypothetical protein